MKYIAFFLLLVSTSLNAAIYQAPTTISVNPDGTMSYDFRGRGPTTVFPDLEKETKTWNVPTSKGTFPVPVETKYPIKVDKLSQATAKFLKKGLPVAGTAVALYEFACEVGLVCHDPADGQLKKKEDSYPPVSPLGTEFQLQSGDWTTSLMDACQSTWPPAYYEIISTDQNYGPQAATCGYRVISSGFQSGGIINKRTQCPPQYFQVGQQCEIKPEYLGSSYRPLTESDYSNPAFNTPSAVVPLLDAGEPLEIEAPQHKPTTKVISSTQETVRDGSGTATGTKTTETRVKIDPDPSPIQNGTTYNKTETTVITTTNITNNTTNTTTIDDTTPEEPPKEDETVEFDTVPEIDLPTHDVTTEFTPLDFGGSSTCPPNPTFTISKGTYTLPFNVACDFAAMIKGIFLILCALTSAFIIAGARND